MIKINIDFKKSIFGRISEYNIMLIVTLFALFFLIMSNFCPIFYSAFKNDTENKSNELTKVLYETEECVKNNADILKFIIFENYANNEDKKEHIEKVQRLYLKPYISRKSNYYVSNYFYNINTESGAISGIYNEDDEYCDINDVIDKKRLAKLEYYNWYPIKTEKLQNKAIVYKCPIFSAINQKEVCGYIGVTIDFNYIKNILLYSDPVQFEECMLIDLNYGNILISDSIYNKNISSMGIDINECKNAIKKCKVFIKDFDVYCINNVGNNLAVLQKGNLMTLKAKSNFMIFVLYFFILAISFAIKKSRKNDEINVINFINMLSEKMSIYLSTKDTLKQKNFVLATIILLIMVLLHSFYMLIMGKSIVLVAIAILFFILWGIAVYVFSFNKVNNRFRMSVINISIMILLLLYMMLGIFTLSIYTFIMSIILLVSICIYTLNKMEFIKVYAISIIIIAIGLFMYIFKSGQPIEEVIILFIMLAIIFSLMLFAMHTLLLNDNFEREKEKDEIYNKLKDTQEIIIANEKMTTLGHIVASVAHEINTPIGAIKASADTFSTSLIPFLESFNTKLEKLNDEEMEIVFDLLQLSFDSVKKLLSTSEIRNAKRQIKEYFEENGFENAFSLANKLTRLEICDLNEISSRIEVFKCKRIEDILNIACDVFFLITGINTTIIASNKVSKIVYALKSYSNMSNFSINGDMEEFSIIDCIDNVITLYSNQFTDKIKIVKDYDNTVANVIGDAEGIGQVCLNVIQNALYAMKDDGGVLTITTRKVGDFIYMQFSDTGCGIPKENLEKIFDPLFTTKPLGEGSGLGLGICKKIIERHGGNINVTSVVNEGSSFLVTLPINQKQKQKEE